jgi:hypothetical protein
MADKNLTRAAKRNQGMVRVDLWLPPGLARTLRARAKDFHRPITSEIVARLKESVK